MINFPFSQNYPFIASLQSSFLIRSSVTVLHIHCINAINYGSLVTHQHRTGQTCPYGKATKEIRFECFMAYHVYINYLHGFMHDFIINYVSELNPYTTTFEIPYFTLKYGISIVYFITIEITMLQLIEVAIITLNFVIIII